MSEKMAVAGYAGAVANPGTIRISATGKHASPANGVLQFVNAPAALPGFITVSPAPAPPVGAVVWEMTVDDGPTVDLPTALGLQTVGPTTPPSRFHFLLAARSVNPVTQQEEPVLLSVQHSGQVLTAMGTDDQGNVVSDDVVEMIGPSIDLYLLGS